MFIKKHIQKIFTYLLFICFFVFIPYVHSQDCCQCPPTVEDVRKDSRFKQLSDFDLIYYFEITKELSLMCYYHQNGTLYLESPDHGIAKSYDENGRLRRKTSYRYKKKHGLEILYTKTGNIDAIIDYSNNIPVGGECFNADGTITFWTEIELEKYKKEDITPCN